MIINTAFEVLKTMQNNKQTSYCCPQCGSTNFYGIAIEYYSTNLDTNNVSLESTDAPEEIKCRNCDAIMENIFDKIV